MKNLMKNKWLLLVVAIVVAYIVYKKFGKGSNGSNGNGNGATTNVDPATVPTVEVKPLPVDEEFSQRFH